MKHHEKILLSDALETAIKNERRNIQLKRIILLESILCTSMGIVIAYLLGKLI